MPDREFGNDIPLDGAVSAGQALVWCPCPCSPALFAGPRRAHPAIGQSDAAGLVRSPDPFPGLFDCSIPVTPQETQRIDPGLLPCPAGPHGAGDRGTRETSARRSPPPLMPINTAFGLACRSAMTPVVRDANCAAVSRKRMHEVDPIHPLDHVMQCVNHPVHNVASIRPTGSVGRLPSSCRWRLPPICRCSPASTSPRNLPCQPLLPGLPMSMLECRSKASPPLSRCCP